ncbi:MAG TPA: MgtC/SapB family protein [Pyrinomonadaceae bacterium]|nr:MgtC/SapB family protein [Pyrinomonadaceae bacterium]HWP54884.1 MgtC/SapB family protein [Pyrinomonadaceae bacterium]
MAVFCGGAIGLEREISHKPAGLRTNVLVCVGATLFMIVSRHIGGGAPYTDPARLVAQVVTAIGFIGAGVILQSRGSIKGLTTAATILVLGAVGVTVGEGMFTVAVMTTVLIIIVLVVLRKIESAFIRRSRLFKYQLKTTDISDSLTRLHGLLESEGLRLDDFSVLDLSDGRHELRFGVVTSLETNNRLIKLLPEIGTEVQGATGSASD